MTMLQNWSTMQRRDLNEHSHIPECRVRDKIENAFLKIDEEVTKMGEKTYIKQWSGSL